jgi:hypothetical protein
MAMSDESNEIIEEELKRLATSIKLSSDYKYFVLMVGLFAPEMGKNMLKLWPKYE